MKLSAEKIFRIGWNTLWYTTVTLLVIAALTLTLARVFLPKAENYKTDIEAALSDLLHQPVEIKRISAAWHGLDPQLVLDDVKFYSKDKTKLINEFAHARIGIDLLYSVLRMRVVPGALVVEGSNLVIVRDSEGRFRIEGFGDNDKPLTDEERQLVSEWVLGQRVLHLQKTKISYVDEAKNNKRFEFPNITFTIRNRGQQHQIDGSIALPNNLGSQLVFALDLRGNILMTNTWSGSGYFAAGALRLDEWAQVMELDLGWLEEGVASVSMWTRWRAAAIDEIRGTAAVNSLTLTSKDDARLIKIDRVSGNFAVEIQSDQWYVTADRVVVTTSGSRWLPSRLDLRYRPATKNAEGEISYVNLSDVARIYSIVDGRNRDVDETVRMMKARGELENFSFFYRQRDGENAFVAASGRFRELSTEPWKEIPGVQQVSGDFAFSNDDGFVNINNENWRLNYPSMFRSVLPFSYLRGTVSWQRENENWRIASRKMTAGSDLASGSGRFAIDVEPDQSPFIDIAVMLNSENVGAAGLFLPSGIMPASAVNWIDGALRSGRFQEGGLLYYGRPSDYPFNKQNGRFDLFLDVDDVYLAYLPDWPNIDSIRGEFNLTSTGLAFDGNAGRIYNNEIRSVTVTIPDFYADDVAVNISGRVEGATQDKLRYLHESPLEQMFASAMKPFRTRGLSNLDIDLHIPLGDQGRFHVDGKLQTFRNHVFAEELNFDVRDFNSEIRFDEDGVYSDASSGMMGPIPFSPRVTTVKSKKLNEIIFRQQTLLDENQVEYIFKTYLDEPHWARFIKGAMDATIELSIPIIKDKAVHKEVAISVWSDMLGVTVNLPQPAYKEPLQNKPLYLRYELSGPLRNFVSSFGDMTTVLETQAANNKLSLARGVVAFDVAPVLPAENGYHFVGNVGQFSWTEWEPLLFGRKSVPGLVSSSGASNPLYIDVKMSEFEFENALFHKLNFNASNAAQGWTFHLDGDEVAGNVFLPTVRRSTPVVVDMSKLYVERPKSSTEDDEVKPSPIDFPQAKIKIGDFRYNTKNFGAIELVATPLPNGIRFEKINTDGPTASIDASGDWVEVSGTQRSSFSVKLNAKNFGDALDILGYGKIIRGGEGILNISANWPGSPTDFAFKNLVGKLGVKLSNTHIVDVNVGAIKMLGVFSLQALPRRIFLDFSDLTNKGLRFDNIEGFFDVQSGDAFTSGLLLLGPTGKTGLAGRIGLAREDFDLVITFVPPAFDTIPILGGLAAADPTLTGATLFAFQQIFKRQFEDISSVQYTVNGNWDKPEIKRVGIDVKPPTGLLNEP